MVAATSDIAKAADSLRDMIAATAAWQSWTGESEANSKLQVDITNIESDEIGTLPRVRIGHGEGADHETQALAAGQGGIASGSMRMTFIALYVGTADWEDEEITFLNNAGDVVSQLVDAEDGLVNLRISQDGPVTRPDEIDPTARQLVRAPFIARFGLEGVSA